MEISGVSHEVREQAIRQRMAPFTLFFVRLRRRGRRWVIEEAVSPLNPFDRQSLHELRALVEETSRRWTRVGTHAQKMGLAWRASLVVGSPLPHAEQHLATLRALIRGRPQAGLSKETPDHASITWTYPVAVKGSVRFAWVFSRTAAENDTTLDPAVYLSAVMGQLGGQLRLCRFCEESFLVAHPWGRACKDCQKARATARRPDVMRVLDRLRKRPQEPSLREKARADLRVFSLTEWKAKWDRKDPLGRGRPQGH